MDPGYGLGQLEDVLSFTHPFVDIVKLGWGSAYLTANLKAKVDLLARFDIRTCPGGMMFEVAWWQGQVEPYVDFLQSHGIDLVEVSNGSLPVTEEDKHRMIEFFAARGFTVLAEVGSKDVTVDSPPETWVRLVKDDLAAGAWKVIVEGRADASAGVYRSDGTVKDDLIEALLGADIGEDNLIFEAPHKPQVAYFVNRVGPNVNIGNIPLEEALNVETLRLGLRGDTARRFFVNGGGAS
ncbi:MAG: phosphosulfolactate synthase [Proteobacteria bacterium]|nr:phosphosulfolactate synthase [Pseudomonadota bacterium]MBU1743213.1 phosphosulfolactate synthase [Pseudomonadota bacterium]